MYPGIGRKDPAANFINVFSVCHAPVTVADLQEE
jgi:hypothetical protein